MYGNLPEVTHFAKGGADERQLLERLRVSLFLILKLNSLQVCGEALRDWLQSVVLGPAVEVSPGIWLQLQILKPI